MTEDVYRDKPSYFKDIFGNKLTMEGKLSDMTDDEIDFELKYNTKMITIVKIIGKDGEDFCNERDANIVALSVIGGLYGYTIMKHENPTAFILCVLNREGKEFPFDRYVELLNTSCKKYGVKSKI